MSGHSHWSKVKRYKGVEDIRRGQLFSKLSKEITIAAKNGGGDPNFNPRLRTAIATARGQSMPSDKIENAINKGTGKGEGSAIEEILYEGYGPGGVAILVEATTDNKNRTAAEIRSTFSKNTGNLGGSVAWMFKRVATFFVESNSEDAVLEATLDAGAQDVKQLKEGVEVICPLDRFDAVEKALKNASLTVREAKLVYLADNLISVTDENAASKLINLTEKLEEHDDTQNVFTNADISEELMNKLHPA
ncbi:MAG: YebC/PmpR family DNA-binding transcriptional regulator [bacterium]